jgi:hypothetical protein
MGTWGMRTQQQLVLDWGLECAGLGRLPSARPGDWGPVLVDSLVLSWTRLHKLWE